MKSHPFWWAIGITAALVFAGLLALYNHTNGLAAVPTGTGSISGVVWQDYCASNCEAGSGLKRANGRVDNAEKKLGAVTVRLYRGKCSDPFGKVAKKTNSVGFYRFTDLAEGYYCVTVNTRQSKSGFPRPGYWSRPAASGSNPIAKYQIHITGATEVVNTSFGWVRK